MCVCVNTTINALAGAECGAVAKVMPYCVERLTEKNITEALRLPRFARIECVPHRLIELPFYILYAVLSNRFAFDANRHS